MADQKPLLGPGVLAQRMELKHLPGLLHKSVMLPEGTRGILLRGGRHDITLRPGTYRYGAGSVGDMSIVVVADAPLPLEFKLEHLATKDPLLLNVESQLAFQLQDPVAFFANLVREQQTYLSEQLAAALHNELDDAARRFVQQHVMLELDQDASLKLALEHELSLQLDRTLTAWGLRLGQLRVARFLCAAYDSTTQQQVEYAIQATSGEAALEGRKRLFEVFTQSELQALVEQTAQVATLEKRTQLWERLRRAVVADRMARVRSDAEMEDFLRQQDRDRLLKDSELEDLKQTLRQAGQDKERAYEFLTRKTEMERDFELKKLDRAHSQELTAAELTFQLTIERQRLEGQWQMEARRLELELQKRRMEADFRRQQEEAEAEVQRQREIESARARGLIQQVEWEEIMREAKGVIELYGLDKDSKLERQHKEQMLHLEEQERAYELERRQKDDEQRRDLELRQEKHKQELERIDAMSKLSTEALIAVADADKAPLLLELAKTRAMSGMSPAQILATQGTPQALEAMKEAMAALSATGQFEQYERLLKEVKESAALSREDYQRNVMMMQGMFAKALDTVKETAVALAPGR